MRAPRQDQDGAARPIDIYARVSRAGDKEMRSTGGQVEVCRGVLADRELPEGRHSSTLVIGAPKIGKSWLVLSLLLAAASGGLALGHIAAGEPRPVLYLALEDSDRRMQDRCQKLLGDGSQIPALFSYQTRLESGLVVDTIRAWLRRTPATGLVVIDTLGKVMPPAMQGESAYQRD
ncbi:MAG TPA: AAA family ATPase [Streptosporangiaceae bacterium]|nr:AAA family ATPase [Streptosporangiaceae bacterium]